METTPQGKKESTLQDKLRYKDPVRLEYERRVAELKEKIETLRQEISSEPTSENPVEGVEATIGLDVKTGEISVERLIEENILPADEPEIAQELHVASPDALVEAVETAVVADLNDKTIKPASERLKATKFQKVRRKIKILLLMLASVSEFVTSGSFSHPKNAEAAAYDNLEVKNLKDWDKIQLYQDAINKLNNINIIIESQKNSDKKYVVVDKSAGVAHLYQGENLISTYEVGVGANKGDAQTVTIVEDGQVYWDSGNKQTGAGIYTINKRGVFEGAPSFTMLNERGIEVPTAFHRTLPSREKFFGNGKTEDNRMSNGCLNFLPRPLNDLIKQDGFGTGTKVYILPDDPHNKFEIKDGELRFTSNDASVNRTIRPYEPKPIVLKAENVTEPGKEFLQILSESKPKLMALYPTVSNDIYNQLTKIAYGIFGQESSFGTYGGGRGQYGRLTDYAGAELGKNVSVGVTQIRITSVNSKTKTAFNIKTTKDLFNIKNAGIATMSLLLDIYVTNIPDNQKGDYLELVPYYYNNPVNSRKTKGVRKNTVPAYTRKVLEYAKRVKVYSLAFEIDKVKSASSISTPEKKSEEEIIKDRIEKCRKIIQSNRYEDVTSDPYLVLSLYYSDGFFQTMKKNGGSEKRVLDEDGLSAKIILGVHPLITKEFRDNYIKTLEKIFAENKKSKTIDLNEKSAPLDNIDISKNLRENHQDAIDLFTQEGSPVKSITGGIVILAENGWKEDEKLSTSTMRGGNTVIVFNPENESFYRYAHMKKTKVRSGEILASGEEIGVVGHTGINASKAGHGQHLHFEINKYNKDRGTMVAIDVETLKKELKKIRRN